MDKIEREKKFEEEYRRRDAVEAASRLFQEHFRSVAWVKYEVEKEMKLFFEVTKSIERYLETGE